ncbi:MAG TPA: FtsX-like permease family protein, partial [Flavisolibacter sp.]
AAKTEKWNEANYITYLLLQSRDQVSTVQEKIDSYSGSVLKKEMQLQGSSYSRFYLEPLKDVHLYSELDGFEPNGNILYIYILAAVAILILLVACVNYTNLSTAQSTGRSVEVGVRKVMGADRKQVFYQFIAESFFTVMLAFMLGIGLAFLLLPYFNGLSGKDLSIAAILQPQLLLVMLVLAIIITFTAGAYPSIVLASGRITGILRSGYRLTGSGSLRKSLIVFQFVISVFLIISTVIIIQQLNYIRNKELGYDKDHVVVMPVDFSILDKYDDLKTALAMHSSIKSVGGAYEDPTHVGWEDGLSKGAEWDEASRISINAMPVDEDFIKTLDLQIIAGTDFNETDVMQFDTSDGGKNLHYSYILNESAVKAFGWTPGEAIGKTVTKNTSGQVKAVVKDFHFRSLKEAIRPLTLFLDKRLVGSLFVKINGDVPAAIAHLEKTWKERIKHRPFEYHFLDEDYNALYKTEEKAAAVFSGFAAIAVILACLGLFALTAYTMVQRTKEIGIRKILGATLADLLVLISKDFLKLVLVAFVIAVPVSWYAANTWLESFVYHIPIQWWVFVMAGLVILAIAFITISMQAIRTSISNPVKNLRTE